MTAPAAALLQRQTPVRQPVQAKPEATAQVPVPAQNPRANSGFAAHLERGTSPHKAEEHSRELVSANDAPKDRAAAISSQPPLAQQQPDRQDQPVTGKTLPDKRQALALSPVQSMLDARAPEKNATAVPEAGLDDAEAQPSPTTANLVPALPLLPVSPAPSTAPASGAAPARQTGEAAQIAATRQPAAAPASVEAATSQAQPSAAPAAVAAPPAAFVLERVGPSMGAPDPSAPQNPAANAQPSAVQSAARAEPSTLAALTGASRSGLRKLRPESDASTPATKSSPVDMTASALASAQPFAGPANAGPANSAPGSADAFNSSSAQPVDGIGFDALVDSIARARDGAGDNSPVSVAMRHAEFGRVSLRFQTDADGLSVAMTSPDPAFAPAVAAAHAAEAATAANADAALRPPQGSTASGSASDQMQSNSQMQGNGRRGPSQEQRLAQEPARQATRREEARTDGTRGGIFA